MAGGFPIKISLGEDTRRFSLDKFDFTELVEKIHQVFNLSEGEAFYRVTYQDSDGDSITIACSDDLRVFSESSNQRLYLQPHSSPLSATKEQASPAPPSSPASASMIADLFQNAGSVDPSVFAGMDLASLLRLATAASADSVAPDVPEAEQAPAPQGPFSATDFAAFVASLGPQIASLGPKLAELGPQIAALGPQIAALGPQIAALGQQLGPQIAAVGEQIAPQVAELGNEIAPRVEALATQAVEGLQELQAELQPQVEALGEEVRPKLEEIATQALFACVASGLPFDSQTGAPDFSSLLSGFSVPAPSPAPAPAPTAEPTSDLRAILSAMSIPAEVAEEILALTTDQETAIAMANAMQDQTPAEEYD